MNYDNYKINLKYYLKATHIAPIQCMDIDSTSSLLATGSSDFACKIWDLNAQYCTHNLKGAQGIIRY